MNKRVAIYLRVSTEEQKKEGLSIVAQKDKLYNYCKFKDWNVVMEYIDEGVSAGSIKKRPQFLQMIKDAKLKKFSTILIVKFDRAFRNTRDAIVTFEELYEEGIDFVSIAEDIDTTTPMGKFFFIIISAFAELERQMTIERNKAVREYKFNSGLSVSRVPFGYKAIYKNKKEKKGVIGMVIDNSNNIVLDCFKMTADGIKYREICNKHKLNPQSYYNIIKNPVYCGYIKFGSELKKGIHSSIISEELFKQLNPNFEFPNTAN